MAVARGHATANWPIAGQSGPLSKVRKGPNVMTTAPEDFFNAYVAAALWSSTGDDGEPLDARFDVHDIAGETLDKMLADCSAFYAANADTISTCESKVILAGDLNAKAGHDFWLTRCGHGAGFWDGDWPEPQAARLTSAAERFGNVDLYVGDDGKIYDA
jgi:hypothetical protein